MKIIRLILFGTLFSRGSLLFGQIESPFELARNDFLAGHILEAKSEFSKIEAQDEIAEQLPISILAQFYLVRIHLLEKEYSLAAQKLSAIAAILSRDDLLFFEWSYLQGELAFQMHEYKKAIYYFNLALPRRHHESAEWYPETLYYLGWSHLKMASPSSQAIEQQHEHFREADSYFNLLLKIQPEERVYLALAQSHLAKATQLKDKNAYLDARKILLKTEVFQSMEARTHALLLQAESAGTYEERKKIYLELTHPSNRGSPLYAKAWYLRGINTFEQALSESSDESKSLFLEAAAALAAATELLLGSDPSRAALAYKYQIKAYLHHHSEESLLRASFLLKTLFAESHIIIKHTEEPQELLYLYGAIAQSLGAEYQQSNASSANPVEILETALAEYPQGAFSDACLLLLGNHYLSLENLLKAEETYTELVKKYPTSSYAPEALYWSAHCAEKARKDPSIGRAYRRQLFENYPSSAFAPTAYFQYYTYRDYLQGDRGALKHLEAFSQLFPDSPLQIHGYYFIGLDYKRERKGASGKPLRKRNLSEAIHAFSKAEHLFETLYQQEKIPKDQINHYLMIRYRALLERALANQTIALDSQSTKRAIYSQYTQELFEQINGELADPTHPFTSHLAQESPFPRIQEESLYLLTKSYMLLENDAAALKSIDAQLEKYAAIDRTQGYYLSRVYYEQGMLAMKHEHYHVAWEALKNAEASYESSYNVDQKLDLWIQQSECCKALGQLDTAMLILSKVVNDPAVSSLRIKAMFLRAEIYALQGRHELARKQLNAAASKGGEWALKAKIKMDESYGFQ